MSMINWKKKTNDENLKAKNVYMYHTKPNEWGMLFWERETHKKGVEKSIVQSFGMFDTILFSPNSIRRFYILFK